MKYTNALIYQSGYGFRLGSFVVEDGRFALISVKDEHHSEHIRDDYSGYDRDHYHGSLPDADDISGEGVVDLGGRYVIPGLVDIHIHGCAGADCSDGDPGGIRVMAEYLASRGVTAFLPTLATLPEADLERACGMIADMPLFSEGADSGSLQSAGYAGNGARVLGLRMEGPYLSPRRKGSQNADKLCKPDAKQFMGLYRLSGEHIRVVDIAPELEGADEFIHGISKICRVSLAHTEADYDTASRAVGAGASHLTHLYNAMPGIHHRNPGVIGAASESDAVTTEIICDGIHVHESAVRMAFKLFPGRICLISDALRCCGMTEGEYEFGGQTIRLTGGAAYLPDGHLAGSAIDLWKCLQKAVSVGIDLREAIDAATIIPATIAGADRCVGSISVGKYADFIVCTPDFDDRKVYMAGRELVGSHNPEC